MTQEAKGQRKTLGDVAGVALFVVALTSHLGVVLALLNKDYSATGLSLIAGAIAYGFLAHVYGKPSR